LPRFEKTKNHTHHISQSAKIKKDIHSAILLQKQHYGESFKEQKPTILQK
jgi:hypothetical protein